MSTGPGAILVTGAGGLVGHAVRIRLEASGHRVVATDLRAGAVEGRPVEAADVTDPQALYPLAMRETIGGIVHCGALSGPMLAADDPSRIVAVNVGGTANLLEVARRIGGVRFVFVSSTSAVGPTPAGLSPVPASVPLNPSTVYGASKAAGEALISGYARQHGVDGVSLRLAWVYGPRRTTACSVRRMLSDAFARRETHLAADAASCRQYVHVDDVAEALVRALETPRLPQLAYAITGGTCLSMGDVVEHVRAILPEACISFGPGDLDDEAQEAFKTSDAGLDFGYLPRVQFADGLTDYVERLGLRRTDFKERAVSVDPLDTRSPIGGERVTRLTSDFFCLSRRSEPWRGMTGAERSTECRSPPREERRKSERSIAVGRFR